MTTTPKRDNPYVGPRPFRKGERLLGRDREARGLTDKLLGERIVLLHSPSGAGKTSLIQAAVIPRMERAGFQLCIRTVPVCSALRMNTEPRTDIPVKNRYVFSAVLGLLGDVEDDPSDLADLTFAQAMDRMLEGQQEAQYQMVIFDQLEEVLTINPADRDSQLEFFKQVGEALDDRRRWALFSMREDYMGGLDQFTRYLPTGLQSRFRLNFLEREAALQAMKRPAAERGVDFTDEAASALFDDLRRRRVQGLQHEPTETLGPYVEPVHVQVVCHRLWRVLSDRLGEEFHSISSEEIAPVRDIAGALSAYYAEAVEDTARETNIDERLIRDWFETELITARGYRTQTLTGPVSDQATVASVLERLEQRYLVRGDRRAGTIWYELTHDRLIEPVLNNNVEWRRQRLADWQKAADEWRRWGRDPALLLREANVLREAMRAVSGREDRTLIEKQEREFVERSVAVFKESNALTDTPTAQVAAGAETEQSAGAGEQPRERRMRTTLPIAALAAIALVEALIILTLLWRR